MGLKDILLIQVKKFVNNIQIVTFKIATCALKVLLLHQKINVLDAIQGSNLIQVVTVLLILDLVLQVFFKK